MSKIVYLHNPDSITVRNAIRYDRVQSKIANGSKLDAEEIGYVCGLTVNAVFVVGSLAYFGYRVFRKFHR